jgi:hypothetical protein
MNAHHPIMPPAMAARIPGPMPPTRAANKTAGKKVAKGTMPSNHNPAAQRTPAATATQTIANAYASADPAGTSFRKIRPSNAPMPQTRTPPFLPRKHSRSECPGMSALGDKRTWRLRCKMSLRAGSGHQRQHEQSCGAALPRFCCVKDARRQRRLARLRLLFRRQRAPRQVERDLHVSHSLWAEVPNFSDHERPQGTHGVANLPETPSRVCPMPDQLGELFAPLESEQWRTRCRIIS